ncbi:hypothetical protein FA13DRAFT_1813475 [Coprinellus micaceus]|uniref:CHAT domain-containing protein n=1 Tax=Coprinellus micaceus TaxID=71717 RepID=A0A4Y7TDJ0_COPMI|nr:hypothetical protein FA13DRAFT_1813475 [Coprinellus micaceus]
MDLGSPFSQHRHTSHAPKALEIEHPLLYWTVLLTLAIIFITVARLLYVFVKAHRLQYHGEGLMYRFQDTEDLSDVDEAITELRAAAQLLYKRLRTKPLDLLGIAFVLRFKQTKSLDDLTASILALETALSLAHEGYSELPGVLNNLAISLVLYFEQTGSLHHLQSGVSCYHEAIKRMPEGHPDLPCTIVNLGNASLDLAVCTGNPGDLDEASSALQDAVQLVPQGHPQLPRCLRALALISLLRWDRAENIDDLKEASSLLQRAVDLTPADDADLATGLCQLGLALSAGHFWTGDRQYLAEAALALDRAVKLTPTGHYYLPLRLSTMGNLCHARFLCSGRLSDLSEAISLMEQAVNITAQGHKNFPMFLNHLALALFNRFARTYDTRDLARGISLKQRAVALTPEGHLSFSERLSDLGMALSTRYNVIGDLQDVEEAILLQRRAVESTRDGDASLSDRLNRLSGSLNVRFGHTGKVDDLEEAISGQQRAVEVSRGDRRRFPSNLAALALLRIAMFEHTSSVEDTSKAISELQEALEIVSDERAIKGEMSIWLNALGIAFQSRFHRTGDVSDINQAVSAGQQAVSLTPKGHAQYSALLAHLGIFLYNRSKASGSAEDLDTSIAHLKESSASGIGAPRVRLAAAKQWAWALNYHYPESLDILLAYDTIVSLIGMIAGHEQTVRHRYSQLQEVSALDHAVVPRYKQYGDPSGLASEAAAVACQMSRPDKALEWLEQGRCLVWRQLNDLRAPLDDLTKTESHLAQTFQDLSRMLEIAGSRLQSGPGSIWEKVSVEDEALFHADIATRWNDTLQKIRSLPGFESFLQPPPCSTLFQYLPTSGPIIILNVNEQRYDAIALTSGRNEPHHIPLPDFTADKAKKYRSALQTALIRAGLLAGSSRALGRLRAKQLPGAHTVRNILQSLWVEVVKPILDALGLQKGDAEVSTALPRIWWCPTGVTSFLPIHAAGVYRGGQLELLSDYAISSYTPTIQAILSRVKGDHPIDQNTRGLFLTCHPTAIPSSPIHGTTAEVALIFGKADECGVRSLKIEGDDLTVEDCLGYMENYSSIHLACHATQNAADPLQSRFRFHQGSLELSTIFQRNLVNADLAFLSACQTSTGEEKLSDEAVHLAAGMLAAGYRRVVATMWAINDRHAQAVANDFYEYLWRKRNDDGINGFDGSLSAYALHHAVQKLRHAIGDSEEAFVAWIPFVHFGY